MAGGAPKLNRLIHERLRLGILSALAVNESLTFNELKKLLQTTDGNLSVHARKLEDAQYISCSKSFENRLPKTAYKLTVTGRRDRLDPKLVAAIERTETATAAGATLTLRVAVDYSARESIQHGRIGPDVDLLIRTGGEQRLSDFLLWECAYAELIFSRRMWPDFDVHDLAAAVREFEVRERRFGGLPEPHAATNGPARHTGSWLD